MHRFHRFAAAAFAVAAASALFAQAPAQTPPMTPDIPAKFVPSWNGYDYVKREVMIPMRDGVKLYTVILVPHNVSQAARMADYAAFILQGELIEYGVSKQMFTAPKEKRTEDYITGRFG